MDCSSASFLTNPEGVNKDYRIPDSRNFGILCNEDSERRETQGVGGGKDRTGREGDPGLPQAEDPGWGASRKLPALQVPIKLSEVMETGCASSVDPDFAAPVYENPVSGFNKLKS